MREQIVKIEHLECNEEVSVNQNTYKIIKLLGHGKGGYSYLAEKDGKNFVLKQIHHEPCSYYTFGNKIEAECRDYKRLEQIGIRMPKMLDVDQKEERILKEYMDEWNFENWGIKYWSKTPEFLEYVSKNS